MANTDANEPGNTALLITGGVLALILAALTVLITVLAQRPVGVPAEIALTVWILLGLSSLLVLLTLVAWIFRIMDKTANRGALNLPNGSISAVIALLLLLLFAFSSIYLFSQLRAGESRGAESTGVSESTLAGFPAERVLSVNVADAGAADGTGRTYDVMLAPASGASTDFAETLFATLSTVVIAIVGFYFGQRATTSGVQAVQDLQASAELARSKSEAEQRNLEKAPTSTPGTATGGEMQAGPVPDGPLPAPAAPVAPPVPPEHA
jgi:hypothetical protein